MLVDSVPGSGGSITTPDKSWDSLRYFFPSVAQPVNLWSTDLTPAGTVPVTASPRYTSGVALASLPDGLVFRAQAPQATGTYPWGLGVSNGTDAGTRFLDGGADGLPRLNWFSNPLQVGDAFYFAGWNGTSGNELWTSDATDAGTHVLADILPGNGSSDPRRLVAAENLPQFYFAASDPEGGRELWRSDGSAEGTRRIADIAPGMVSGLDDYPEMAAAANLIFFVGDDGESGNELWAVPGQAPGVVPDGGARLAGGPLRADRIGESIRLSWSPAVCGPDVVDYAVYSGTLGAFDTHVPLACSTNGETLAELPLPAGSSYFLSVPQATVLEGSYGKDSSGRERPHAVGACRPRVLYDACPSSPAP